MRTKSDIIMEICKHATFYNIEPVKTLAFCEANTDLYKITEDDFIEIFPEDMEKAIIYGRKVWIPKESIEQLTDEERQRFEERKAQKENIVEKYLKVNDLTTYTLMINTIKEKVVTTWEQLDAEVDRILPIMKDARKVGWI